MPAPTSGGTDSRYSANPKIASHIGTRAMSSAAMPVGIVCSPQATRPVPPRSSIVPTIDASRTWTRVGRAIRPRFQAMTRSDRITPAGTNRNTPITNTGMVSMATFMPRYVEPHTT